MTRATGSGARGRAPYFHFVQIAVASVIAIALPLFAAAPAQAGCDFTSFWSGGCNKQIEKALTPAPPSKWFPPRKEPNCGALNQAPCTVVQRIPSCKDGLTESISQKKCVTTPPGTLPFFNTVSEMAEIAVNSREACLRDGNRVAGTAKLNSFFTSGQMFNRLPRESLNYVAVGFVCAAPGILEPLTALQDVDATFWKQFEVAFNEMFSTKPCADEKDPAARAVCAVGQMMFKDMFSESVCTMKSLSEIPNLFGAGGPEKAVEAYNRLGEGIFLVLQFTLEQYVTAKLAAPLKAKFKAAAIKRKRASNLRSGKMEDMRQYEHKIDRVLEIVKYVSLGSAITTNLRVKMSQIPECKDATGHGFSVDLNIRDAWAAQLKGSGAVVKPETLFLVNDQGHLLRFVHDARGFFTVAGQVVSTQNWNTMKFMGAASLPNGGTALYTVLANGDLYYYTLDGNGKFQNWGTRIGTAWGGFTHFMVARLGVIYVVDGKGDLIIYRHDNSLKFGPARVIGNAWGGFRTLISGGTNAFYAVNADGLLRYYYHDDNYTWKRLNQVIGNGWAFKHLNSAGNGELYAVNEYGDLLFYRHNANAKFVDGSGAKIGLGWGDPGKFGLIVAQH